MALYTIDEAYAAANRATSRSGRPTSDPLGVLVEHRKVAQTRTRFDIFLSHSSTDWRLVLGAKQILEDLSYSVYVDWIDDPQLDRSKVDKETARTLRTRMRSCSAFLFATSTNTSSSKWMPWEIGYFDGFRSSQIAIFPLMPNTDRSFQGQEYLGLYPYIERITDYSLGPRSAIGIVKTASTYLPLGDFISGSDASRTGYR